MAQQQTEPRYESFVSQIRDRLEQIRESPDVELTDMQAFVYLIAELFETTSEEMFVFTDGGGHGLGDGGIDFYLASQTDCTIYQCKGLDWSNPQDEQKVHSFDGEPIREIRSAISFLQDPEGNYPYKPEVLQLRTMYHQYLADSTEAKPQLTATVAVLGELTEDALITFNAAKQAYASQGIRLNLITWREISRELERFEAPSQSDFSVDLHIADNGKDIISMGDVIYLVVHGFDLVKSFDEQGWRLFDLNVRLELPKSVINKKIQRTLVNPSRRRNFHLYNNGLLITCRQWTHKPGGLPDVIRLRSPQVINDCQTVRAMCRAYNDLPPVEQQLFREQVRVHVKVVRTPDSDLIGELVQSTNEQNPMNPRNLKANSPEQRKIKQAFQSLSPKWYYETKDGEYSSLRSAVRGRVRDFHSADYEVTRRLVRRVSNAVVAQAWYSLTGHASESRAGAQGGGAGYFTREQIYRRIFTTTPNDLFWERFKRPDFRERDVDAFRDEGTPSAFQFLWAATVDAFVKLARTRPVDSRNAAVKRGQARHELSASPTREQQDSYLLQDTDLRVDRFRYELKDVLVELIGFVLVNRYGGLTPNTCRLLLGKSHEKDFVDNAWDSDNQPPMDQDRLSILGPTYAFALHCTRQFYYLNSGDIESSQSLRNYVSNHDKVVQIKETILTQNTQVTPLIQPWKQPDVSFLDSLPDLR